VPGPLRALREYGRPDGLAPQPTLAELDTLIAQVSAAGLPVELRVEGTPRPLPAAIDLSAYRIAQEALTNTLKHGGPARARLTICSGPDSLEVAAVDNGHGPRPPGAVASSHAAPGQATPLWTAGSTAAGDGLRSPTGGPGAGGSGHGLVGMHERVRLFGGDLEAGPGRDGGFRVAARFPLPGGPR
jgi:signal transduction histidine kinase